MSSSNSFGAREVVIFIVGLAVAVVAAVLVFTSDNDETTAAPTSPEQVEETEEPTTDQTPAPITAPPGSDVEQDGPDPDSPAPADPADTQAPEEVSQHRPDLDLREVPDDETDPRAVAARYVTDSRSIHFEVPPNAWVDEADYLTDTFAEQLGAGTDLIVAQWEDGYIEDQFVQRVENVQVRLEESDDQGYAFVFVQWNTYTMQQGTTDSRGSAQAVVVILEDQDGQWLVMGEGLPH